MNVFVYKVLSKFPLISLRQTHRKTGPRVTTLSRFLMSVVKLFFRKAETILYGSVEKYYHVTLPLQKWNSKVFTFANITGKFCLF